MKVIYIGLICIAMVFLFIVHAIIN